MSYLLQVAEQPDLKLCVSHSVFLARRDEVDDLENYVVEPISASVGLMLRKRLMKEEWRRQLEAFQDLATVPENRLLAGRVFESMAQLQLQRDIALHLVPMERKYYHRRRGLPSGFLSLATEWRQALQLRTRATRQTLSSPSSLRRRTQSRTGRRNQRSAPTSFTCQVNDPSGIRFLHLGRQIPLHIPVHHGLFAPN